MAPPCAALRALSTEGAMTVVVVVVLITCAGVVRSATGRTRLAALPVAKSSADVGCVLRPSSEALLFAVLSSRRPGRDGRDRWARKKERKGSGVVERAEREKEAEGKEKARKKKSSLGAGACAVLAIRLCAFTALWNGRHGRAALHYGAVGCLDPSYLARLRRGKLRGPGQIDTRDKKKKMTGSGQRRR